MKNRILSVILALVMVAALMPVAAQAKPEEGMPEIKASSVTKDNIPIDNVNITLSDPELDGPVSEAKASCSDEGVIYISTDWYQGVSVVDSTFTSGLYYAEITLLAASGYSFDVDENSDITISGGTFTVSRFNYPAGDGSMLAVTTSSIAVDDPSFNAWIPIDFSSLAGGQQVLIGIEYGNYSYLMRGSDTTVYADKLSTSYGNSVPFTTVLSSNTTYLWTVETVGEGNVKFKYNDKYMYDNSGCVDLDASGSIWTVSDGKLCSGTAYAYVYDSSDQYYIKTKSSDPTEPAAIRFYTKGTMPSTRTLTVTYRDLANNADVPAAAVTAAGLPSSLALEPNQAIDINIPALAENGYVYVNGTLNGSAWEGAGMPDGDSALVLNFKPYSSILGLGSAWSDSNKMFTYYNDGTNDWLEAAADTIEENKLLYSTQAFTAGDTLKFYYSKYADVTVSVFADNEEIVPYYNDETGIAAYTFTASGDSIVFAVTVPAGSSFKIRDAKVIRLPRFNADVKVAVRNRGTGDQKLRYQFRIDFNDGYINISGEPYGTAEYGLRISAIGYTLAVTGGNTYYGNFTKYFSVDRTNINVSLLIAGIPSDTTELTLTPCFYLNGEDTAYSMTGTAATIAGTIQNEDNND